MTPLRAIAVGCLVGALFGGVAAAESPRVLLVIDQSDDPFAERIRAEIASLGMQVVVAEPWRGGDQVVSLDAATRAAHAAAGIRMVASRKGVEIWFADQPAGRSLLRQLIVDERSGDPNQGLVALQTAELLRTSLMPAPPVVRKPVETPPPAKAPATPPAPAAVVAAAAPPAPGPRSGVQAAFGALVSPNAGDAAMQTWLSMYRYVAERWALALDVSLPLRAATLSGIEGSAQLDTYLVGLALVTGHDAGNDGYYVNGGLGIGLVRIGANGVASKNYPTLSSQTPSTSSGVVYARGDAGLAAGRWMRFGLRAVAGAATSKVSLQFAGNEAGVWGRPFLAGLVIAELTWQ